MSTVAKIFVVINLLLAVAFFALSANLFVLRTDWRAKAEGLEQTVAERDATVSELQDDVNSLQNLLKNRNQELADYRAEKAAEINELTTQLQDARRERDSLDDKLQTLNDNLNNMSAQLDSQAEEIQEAHAAAERAREEADAARDARRDAEQRETETEQARAALEQQADQLAVELADARQRVAELQDQIERYVRMGIDPPDVVAAKDIDGVVLAVSARVNQLIISVGKDDNVAVGDVFVVSRGSNYVGRVIVEKVYQDMAAARSDPERQELPIQEGDRVSTRP